MVDIYLREEQNDVENKLGNCEAVEEAKSSAICAY
jgi:hypothetical protein